MTIFRSAAECIGKTPLIRLERLEQELGLKGILLAKVEGMNPAGSAKDRAAMQMIADAEQQGLLSPGALIVEPTSGNTGIGLAFLAAQKGYRALFTMPDTMSRERQMLLRAYGAEIVLTEGSRGMSGAIEKAKEIVSATEGAFLAGQFDNPSNAKAHYRTTGPEIWEDTEGKVDFFVSAVGTGGTITGTGQYLKEQNETVQIVAVEPKKSAVLSGGATSSHGIQGIGAGFIPKVLDTALIDCIYQAEEEEAYEAARLLAKKEGILAGISSGAALAAAIHLLKTAEAEGKNVVVILPDTGERYLSTALFAN